jgi:hypothetical protein
MRAAYHKVLAKGCAAASSYCYPDRGSGGGLMVELVFWLGRLIALLLVVMIPARGLASPSSTLYVGTGVFLQNMLTTTTTPESSANVLGQVNLPQVSLMADLRGFSRFGLAPSVALTPVALTGGNGVKKSIFLASLPLAWTVGQSASFKFGPGLLQYSVRGDGGTTELNNGTGTSTFYLPGSTKSSKVFVLNVGMGFDLFRKFRFDLDAVVPGIMSSKRALNLMATAQLGIW